MFTNILRHCNETKSILHPNNIAVTPPEICCTEYLVHSTEKNGLYQFPVF